MKMRVADYIASLLTQHGITDVFSVVGGGAMHLNDAFGNCEGLHVTYTHHEQAAAIAAEGYARAKGIPAAVCVTTGPGGTNAITGVLCAWQDNIPMLVISGQVRYETTVESTGLPLRQFGEQEHYIIDTIQSMTKYSVMIKDVETVRYHVEKAIALAMEGRCGPCWLDVPLNIQGATIETEDQKPYLAEEMHSDSFSVERVCNALRKAQKPVILAGSGIRTSGSHNAFKKFVEKMGIPVIAATSNADILPVEDKNYFGNFGVFGGRPGNFIVQNADCILSLGCRLSFKQTGFDYQQFAPKAKKIVVDIDANELKKKTTHIDIPVHCTINKFLDEMLPLDLQIPVNEKWIRYCNVLKRKYPIFLEKHAASDRVNPYYFFARMQKFLDDDAILVAGNSCACVCLLQSGVVKENQRLWGNVNCGTMGYDLPAAVGAAIASGKPVVCVTGDGSIQMNIQELQTVVGNQLPVKIIVFNNNGYHAIVQSQSNFFGRLTGCTEQSGITFPSFERLAYAYQMPYYCCKNHKDVDKVLKDFLKEPLYAICEVMEDEEQPIEPKSKSKILPNGQIVSPPIYDLAPFLDSKELEMYSDFEAGDWDQ